MSDTPSPDSIPTRFVVDRTKWYRGNGPQFSMLRRPDGCMCCLGFVSAQCGVPEDDLHRGTPFNLPMFLQARLPEFMRNQRAFAGSLVSPVVPFACNQAMQVNDDPQLAEADREAKLKEIFKQQGYELEFIN